MLDWIPASAGMTENWDTSLMVSVDSFLPSLLLALRLLKLNGEWDSYWKQKGVVTVCPPNVCLLTLNV